MTFIEYLKWLVREPVFVIAVALILTLGVVQFLLVHFLLQGGN